MARALTELAIDGHRVNDTLVALQGLVGHRRRRGPVGRGSVGAGLYGIQLTSSQQEVLACLLVHHTRLLERVAHLVRMSRLRVQLGRILELLFLTDTKHT